MRAKQLSGIMRFWGHIKLLNIQMKIAEHEDKEEDEFLAKLADAKILLYPTCVHHSKLSAIVSTV